MGLVWELVHEYEITSENPALISFKLFMHFVLLAAEQKVLYVARLLTMAYKRKTNIVDNMVCLND